MTPFLKLVKKVTEKTLGVWNEGPDAPDRLEAMVVAFMRAHPKATRGEWAAFASKHAAEAYRSGYVRGYEWAERDLDRKPTESPECEAHHELHALHWDGEQLLSDLPPVDLGDMVPDVTDDSTPKEFYDRHDEAVRATQERQHLGKRYSR